MNKKKYIITGVALWVLYFVLVSIFANSEAIQTNHFLEILLPFVMAFCIIGGIVFLILGFKKHKKDEKFEMTKELAHSIIRKIEKTKKVALLLLVVAVVFVFIGYFLNENIAKIGVAFWIVGVFAEIFAKESKKYKWAQMYLKEYESISTDNK